MGIKSSSTPPTPHDAPLATACAPTPYPWRSCANVPSRSCGTLHAGGGRHFCALSAVRTAEQHQSVGESHGPPRLSQPGRSSIPGQKSQAHMASSPKLVAKQTAPVGVPRAAVVATARRLCQATGPEMPEVLTPRDAQAVTGRIRITATALRPFIDQQLVAREVPYLSLKSPNSHWPIRPMTGGRRMPGRQRARVRGQPNKGAS